MIISASSTNLLTKVGLLRWILFLFQPLFRLCEVGLFLSTKGVVMTICEFTDCDREATEDRCCHLHFNQTCRGLKHTMELEKLGQYLTPQTLLAANLSDALTACCVVGLSLFGEHSALLDNKGLISWISNKRKREQEERLQKEVNEYNDYKEAEEARAAASAEYTSKTQAYESQLKLKKTTIESKDGHLKAVEALAGMSPRALPTLKDAADKVFAAYEEAAAIPVKAEPKKFDECEEEEIRILSGPIITEADE